MKKLAAIALMSCLQNMTYTADAPIFIRIQSPGVTTYTQLAASITRTRNGDLTHYSCYPANAFTVFQYKQEFEKARKLYNQKKTTHLKSFRHAHTALPNALRVHPDILKTSL